MTGRRGIAWRICYLFSFFRNGRGVDNAGLNTRPVTDYGYHDGDDTEQEKGAPSWRAFDVELVPELDYMPSLASAMWTSNW